MTQIIHILPEIDKAIWDKDKAKPKPARKPGQGRHHNSARIPDETILAMRRMHEVERKTRRQVQAAFPEIDPFYVLKILAYENRANLRLPAK